MQFQILDVILLPELKVQHERLLQEELGLTLEERKEKIPCFQSMQKESIIVQRQQGMKDCLDYDAKYSTGWKY